MLADILIDNPKELPLYGTFLGFLLSNGVKDIITQSQKKNNPMECPRCRTVCDNKTMRCPRCFTQIPRLPFKKEEFILREGVVLLGFAVFWGISFLRTRYLFVRSGIPANFENEIFFALGTTLIAYGLYWIIRLIFWGIKTLKS